MPGYHSSGLSKAGFKRGQLSQAEQATLMETFGADGSIAEVLGVIGDGKEATVYACRAGPDTGVERAIAKVYRAQKFRAFSNASRYLDGQVVGDARATRAIRNKTKTGRLMTHHVWVEREWQTLCRVFDAGASVPEPYTKSGDAILMEWVGDADGVAPLLRQAKLTRDEARRAFDDLLASIELFLSCDLVHGDLSAYNVLWDGERACVIDFPQAIDARQSPHTYDLLRRDVANVCRWAARQGIRWDAARHAHHLWQRYRRGEL